MKTSKALLIWATCIVASFSSEVANAQNVVLEKEPAVETFEKRKDAWNYQLRGTRFLYPNGSEGLLASLKKYKSDVPLHLIYSAKKPEKIKLEVHRDGRAILCIPIHLQTSFASEQERLVVAEYGPNTPGCTVVAYDLSDGEQLWMTKLQSKFEL